ncbi:hypothetical protein DBR23_23385 [Acidovorax sp. HMWF018]|uniref:hypothetical protein n=1 Tax=Acidovorax sp. HMWF018 TaxID=2056855 RepID=UPI000D331C8F|nr:hypothetical protein [Acidovorax sp. HMWF018]PTT35452.1 hypothetical protein DBR23_23385 [Acidovorax sp. HMWF018]
MATAKKTTASKPGTAVAVKSSASSAIVSIQEQLKAQVAAQANKIAPPSGINIRITQDKKFQLPDGSTVEGPLDLVVVDFVSRNSFYEGAYDPNNIVPPTCFAIHPEPKQMVPSDNSPVKQADDCASCPMNQFNSAGKGKACKNSRVLAVLPPDATEDTPLWLLTVSPTALKNFDSFVGSVARTFQMPPIAVIASVDFNPGVTYASLNFSDPRPNENLAVHFARQAEAKELLTVEPDVSSYGQEPAKPARPAARKPTVAARKPAVAARR